MHFDHVPKTASQNWGIEAFFSSIKFRGKDLNSKLVPYLYLGNKKNSDQNNGNLQNTSK